jgi:hypothetical protein
MNLKVIQIHLDLMEADKIRIIFLDLQAKCTSVKYGKHVCSSVTLNKHQRFSMSFSNL